jgi:CRISPR-associated protein Csm4
VEFLAVETLTVLLTPCGSYTSDLNSDTLFGAVCWALADLKLVEVGPLLEGFEAEPHFAFSSVFPRLHADGAEVKLYPMPLIPPLRAEQLKRLSERLAGASGNVKRAKQETVQRAKQLAKVMYVSERIFGEIVRGETDAETLAGQLKDREENKPEEAGVEAVGRALLTRDERQLFSPDKWMPPFAHSSDVQRNQIDRVAGATVEGLLFYEHQTFLRKEVAGLWCLVRTDRRAWMEAAFRYLADTGIGGRRTSGRNQFQIELREGGALPDAGNAANAFIVLSRYLPAAGEWQGAAPLHYRLQNVRGKHETKFPSPFAATQSPPIYKKLVRLLAEGSVLPLGARRDIYGRIVRVGELPDRTVWHSGLALAAFAKID